MFSTSLCFVLLLLSAFSRCGSGPSHDSVTRECWRAWWEKKKETKTAREQRESKTDDWEKKQGKARMFRLLSCGSGPSHDRVTRERWRARREKERHAGRQTERKQNRIIPLSTSFVFNSSFPYPHLTSLFQPPWPLSITHSCEEIRRFIIGRNRRGWVPERQRNKWISMKISKQQRRT